MQVSIEERATQAVCGDKQPTTPFEVEMIAMFTEFGRLLIRETFESLIRYEDEHIACGICNNVLDAAAELGINIKLPDELSDDDLIGALVRKKNCMCSEGCSCS